MLVLRGDYLDQVDRLPDLLLYFPIAKCYRTPVPPNTPRRSKFLVVMSSLPAMTMIYNVGTSKPFEDSNMVEVRNWFRIPWDPNDYILMELDQANHLRIRTRPKSEMG